MIDLDRLTVDINKLREALYYVIQQKNGDLLDPDVQTVCISLNGAINQYTRFVENQPNVLS